MKAIKFYITLILCGVFHFSNAQDPIFTQYFMVPQTINPGFAGYMETMNAGILHRTQWPDLNLNLETEYAFFNTWVEGMNSGIGVNILNHRENSEEGEIKETSYLRIDNTNIDPVEVAQQIKERFK